jgi:hypothetical protein
MTAEEEKTATKLSDLWLGRLKIGLIAAAIGGTFSFGSSVFNRFDVFNTALAQTQAQQVSNTARLDRQEQRIEAIDGGGRAAVERLERKIDANNEQAQKERAEDRALLKSVLAEVKKL